MGDTETQKPTIPDVLPLVERFARVPGNACGGVLHIVLDDDNVEDEDVAFCLRYAEKEGDALGVELATALAAMSYTQRRKIAALWGGIVRRVSDA